MCNDNTGSPLPPTADVYAAVPTSHMRGSASKGPLFVYLHSPCTHGLPLDCMLVGDPEVELSAVCTKTIWIHVNLVRHQSNSYFILHKS